MKKGWIWGIVILIIVLIIIYYFNQKQKEEGVKRISKSITIDGKDKILTYRLPTDMDTDVFGPVYWKAFENLASEIPCSICRHDAESMVSFMHDLVNIKLDKPIFNQKNYDKWMDNIKSINAENGKHI